MKDLQSGDKLLIQSGAGNFGKKQKLQIKTLKETYPKEWSIELGRVLGWLVGDGWLRSGDRNCRVGFTFGENDKELRKYFTDVRFTL